MNIENTPYEDIARGIKQDHQLQTYECLACGKTFTDGEVYPIDGRFFEAEKAAQHHLSYTHPDYLQYLLNSNARYNSLTDNQKQLLQLFAACKTDKEIAQELKISPSTVRHQKFTFREKAKQAKMFLAVYRRVFEDAPAEENPIVPLHSHARMVDERYIITTQEREKILGSVFYSLQPLRLKTFPPKEKKKVVILTEISGQFEAGKQYSEKEVNSILKAIYDDFVTLRRYLIEYGFLDRTKDGSAYWLLP